MEWIALSGVLHLEDQGFGFLRSAAVLPGEWRGIYVSASIIRRFQLQEGDFVAGLGRPLRKGEHYYGLLRVESVNGNDIPGRPIPSGDG
jgi:transcription termination factor Rho